MVKILANDGIHPDGQKMLEEAGFEVDTQKIAQEALAERLPHYDAIIVRSATKVRQDLIDRCPGLKIIARGGVGLDNIDVGYAKSKGIAVINTPAASSEAVAELAFAHLFSLARFLHKANRDMPARGESDFKALKKSYSKGFQLRDRTIGIIGFGRIGQETAKIALGLGMKVLAADPMIDEADISFDIYKHGNVKINIRTIDLHELLSQADIISIHTPFFGKAILGKAEFELMKEGIIIINAARGGTVDEEALLAALNSGRVAAAGLDVFESEPKPRKEFLKHDNVSLSPHIGASTGEAQRNIGVELADKIIAHFS